MESHLRALTRPSLKDPRQGVQDSRLRGLKGCLLALSVTVFAAVLAACSDTGDRQYLINARDYLHEQDLRAAIIELKNALREDPYNAEARYLLGRIYLDIGDAAGAQKELGRASEAGWDPNQVTPAMAEALLLQGRYAELLERVEVREDYPRSMRAELMAVRARALLGQERNVAAEQTLGRAIQLDSTPIQVWLARIQLALQGEDLRGAAQIVEEALEAHPQDPHLRLWQGRLALAHEDLAGAEDAFAQVIATTASRPITRAGWEARIGLIRAQITRHEFEQAEATVQTLLKQSPANPEVNYLGGTVAFERGDYELALKRLVEVLNVVDHVPSMLLLGAVGYAQHNYEQAAYYLSKYLANTPDNAQARKLLGRTYLLLEQYDSVRRTLRPMLASAAKDAELLAMVGISDLRSGDVSSGIQTLEQASAAAPENAAYRAQLAKAYLMDSQNEKAVQELEAVLAQGDRRGQARILLVMAYLREGEFSKAIAAAQELLESYPEDPGILTLVGGVYELSGDGVEARRYFSEALEIRPGYVPAVLNLARMASQAGDPEAAHRLYRSALKIDPKAIPVMLALARISESEGDAQEGLAWLVKANRVDPNDVSAAVRLGERYLQQGEIEKAEGLAKDLAEAHPRNPAALALKARVLAAQRRYNEAIPVLNAMVSVAPRSPVAFTLQGDNYAQLGSTDRARRSLNQALKLKPDFAPAMILLAQVEQKAGRYADALKLGDRLVEGHPDEAVGHEIRGNALLAREDFRGARDAYRKAWAKTRTGGLAVKLAGAMAKAGDTSAAQGLLREWLKDHPDDVLARLALGSLLQEAGKARAAIKEYQRVLERQPDNVAALNNLAWLYHEADDPRALQIAGRAYRADPRNPSVQDTYGWILVGNGQAREAVGVLTEAARSLPRVPAIRYHLAVALIRSGEREKGRQMLTDLLASGQDFEGREQARELLH